MKITKIRAFGHYKTAEKGASFQDRSIHLQANGHPMFQEPP